MEAEGVLSRENEFLWCNATFEFLSENLNPSIESLNLNTDHVDLNSARLISQLIVDPNNQLIDLSLDQCRLTVNATIILIQALAQSKIRYLSLNRNVITNEVCDEIAKALSNNPPLEYLSLSSCYISADGCCSIAKALPQAKQLKTLILNSNCIFDKGCQEIANNISNTNIQEISVAENQIWFIDVLLKSIMGNQNITALDLSYNIVDLSLLVQCVKETPNLKSLAISGCKVNEGQVLLFLEELGRTQLSTLIIDGLNYNQLPIAWPHNQDVLWANRPYFESLIRAIRTSQTLDDLRFGFLDIKQINSIFDLYNENKLIRPIIISISDFGRTENNWVINFPDFVIEAPLSTLKWTSRILPDEAHFFSTIFQKSVFEGNPLDGLDISGTSITDDILQKIIGNFHETNLRLLDLSNNDFGDMSVETITPFFDHSSVEQLFLTQTNLTEFGFQRFFRYFVRHRPNDIPKVLKFSFTTTDTNEMETHQFINDLATLIETDSRLEELEIHGFVTTQDVTPLFSALVTNSHLKSLSIPDIPEKYQTTDYQIDPNVQESYVKMVDALNTSLFDESSVCTLSHLNYPLLTQIFLYDEQILAKWGQIETKMAENSEIH